MKLDFIRVNVLPDMPKESTLYFVKTPGSDNLMDIVLIGNTPDNVRTHNTGTGGVINQQTQTLHPELNLFDCGGC